MAHDYKQTLHHLPYIYILLIQYNYLKHYIVYTKTTTVHRRKGTVQLRCNFILACEWFTRTLKQFTYIHIELLMVCALLLTRNSCKIIRWSSRVVSDTVTHASLGYHVIDHHNVHRLVLGLVSHSQNLCHRALIH